MAKKQRIPSSPEEVQEILKEALAPLGPPVVVPGPDTRPVIVFQLDAPLKECMEQQEAANEYVKHLGLRALVIPKELTFCGVIGGRAVS